MRKTLIWSAMLCALAGAGECWAQGEALRLSDDANVLYVSIGGAELAIPKEGDGFYAVETTFVQNDTTFLYREYAFDSASGQFQRSSCFIVPRTSADYSERLDGTVFMWDEAKHAEYFADMFEEQRQNGPPLVHNDLGDMPRLWNIVLKYNGQYYISADSPWTFELRDSAMVVHGMELYIFALRNVRKVGDGYRFEFDGGDGTQWSGIELQPVRGVEGLWTYEALDFDGRVNKTYVTPRREATNFDLICRKAYHESATLWKYEE